MGLSIRVRGEWYREQVSWGKTTADFIAAHGAVIEMMAESKDDMQVSRLAAAAEITWEQLSDFLEEEGALDVPRDQCEPHTGKATHKEEDATDAILSLEEIALRIAADGDRVEAALELLEGIREGTAPDKDKQVNLIHRVLSDIVDTPGYVEDVERWGQRFRSIGGDDATT